MLNPISSFAYLALTGLSAVGIWGPHPFLGVQPHLPLDGSSSGAGDVLGLPDLPRGALAGAGRLSGIVKEDEPRPAPSGKFPDTGAPLACASA